MRHKVIAHRIFNSASDCSLQQVPGVSVSEIRSSYNAIEALFQACTFGGEFVTTLYPNTLSRGKPVQKDIDEIFGLIVKNSDWLRQPERHGEFWPTIKKQKTKDEINQFNSWRNKFDLPQA
jgi:hypothetical protein